MLGVMNHSTGKNSLKPLEGKVTGVINSANKCGVFVEIPSMDMTGLVPIEADKACKL